MLRAVLFQGSQASVLTGNVVDLVFDDDPSALPRVVLGYLLLG